MPGLVPGIPLRWAQCRPKRDGRVKPGHDIGEHIVRRYSSPSTMRRSRSAQLSNTFSAAW